MRITEVPVPTRYFKQASSASFIQSCIYGIAILWLLGRYLLHRSSIIRQRRFQSLERRYSNTGVIKHEHSAPIRNHKVRKKLHAPRPV